MSKRTNPIAVKSALAYTVEEAANALSKTPATIRNWVKDGLPIMASHKPYLISGAAIREYLRAKRKDAKRPLEPDELYCPACRQGRRPTDMTATLSVLTANTSLLKGICSHCECPCARMISAAKVSEFAGIFIIKKAADSEP